MLIGRWQLELRAFVDFAGIEGDAFVLRVRGDAMFRVHVGDDAFVELGLGDGTLVVDRSEGREAGVVDAVSEACDSWSVR